ncbi:MAG: hypothetical protein HFH82_10085 [Lachnospiraceae bacterium]|nr:hypothetical protein [Lachnospiraceae bacterium]
MRKKVRVLILAVSLAGFFIIVVLGLEWKAQSIFGRLEKKNKGDCLFCGGSAWGYYKDVDSIGILNLISGQICDIGISTYGEKSYSKEYFVKTTMDGEGRYCRFMIFGSRGICKMNLSWDKDKAVVSDDFASLYCRACMEKLSELYVEWNGACFEEEVCPFVLIDFTTGKFYALNRKKSSFFIRDYYIILQAGEQEVDGEIFYAPEGSIK